MKDRAVRSTDGSPGGRGDLDSPGNGDRGPSPRRSAIRRSGRVTRPGAGPGAGEREPARPGRTTRPDEGERELAHDLAEALGTVSLFAEALEDRLGADPDPGAAADLAGLRAGLTRIETLIAATLEPRGGAAAAHRPVDTDLALREARANVEARARAAGARIVAEPLPWVLGDAPSLVRLFQNLLANAIEHRDPRRPPRIRIGARPAAGEAWLFEVADNGSGLASGSLEGGPDEGGLGIGICARIVAAHGGRLSSAPQPGGGTAVSFELPRARPTASE